METTVSVVLFIHGPISALAEHVLGVYMNHPDFRGLVTELAVCELVCLIRHFLLCADIKQQIYAFSITCAKH